jgi:regulator of sirC expression with transglutaminase-like and TPR domain
VFAPRYRPLMSTASRDRLLRLVRRNDADLAEAALLCCVEAEPDLDVDLALLRIDALADGLRASGFRPLDADTNARRIAAYLAGEQGFVGDAATYHDPDNALLTRVLDRKRGLPITLSIVYVSIARRLEVPAYAVQLPGHVVAAVAGGERPVVVDPFHGGVVLDEAAIAARIEETTGGQLDFRRSMLRPTPAVDVVRRLLNNLTRDFLAADRPRDALWTVELKLLLSNRVADDHRMLGEVLLRLGAFDTAADAFEAYLEEVGPDAPAAEQARRSAIGARARLN